jgi:DNA repair exonuclease SbcCD ATPase subunit
MKFRDWKVKKVVEEAKGLLEQIGSFGTRGSTDVPDDLKSKKANPRRAAIAKRKAMMRKLQDQIDRIKDGQKSLKDEMDRDPELEAKHRDLFDELDDKRWEYIEQRNDLEQEIQDIEDEDVEDEDYDDYGGPEEPEDKGVSDKAEKHLKDTETKKSIAKQTKEIKDMEEKIKKTKEHIQFSKRAQTATGWTDSQREREKRNLEHNTKKLKEYEQKLKELVARHKEATGQ